MHDKGRSRAYIIPMRCISKLSKFRIDPFNGFQLMSFYTDRHTDRQTTLRFYVYMLPAKLEIQAMLVLLNRLRQSSKYKNWKVL